MFDEAVLAAAWKSAQDYCDIRNDGNAKIDREEYAQWSQDRENAAVTGRIPRPRYPYHRKLVLTADAGGNPLIIESNTYVFSDPPPPAPHPTVTVPDHTDAEGAIWKYVKVADTPWGPAYNWVKQPVVTNSSVA